MRINGPSPQFGISPVKVRRAGESDESFDIPEEMGRSETKSSVRTAATSSLGALIAAQLHMSEDEQDERRRKRRRNVKQGQDQLALLDEIKLEFLGGKLSPSHVMKLLAGLDARERDSGDPKLEAILDEIELRSRVELAKLKRRETSV